MTPEEAEQALRTLPPKQRRKRVPQEEAEARNRARSSARARAWTTLQKLHAADYQALYKAALAEALAAEGLEPL